MLDFIKKLFCTPIEEEGDPIKNSKPDYTIPAVAYEPVSGAVPGAADDACSSVMVLVEAIKQSRRCEEGVQQEVETAIDDGSMPISDLVSLAAMAFSNHLISLYASGEAVPACDLASLAEHFLNQPKAMDALSGARIAHKPIIASAVLSCMDDCGTLDRTLTGERLSKAFDEVCRSDLYGTERALVKLWSKVFVASVSFADEVPSSLVGFATGSKTHGAMVTSRISDLNRGSRNWAWMRSDDRERLRSFSAVVLEAIAESFPSDYVALITLGHIYLGSGRYDDARDCFRRALAVQVALGASKKEICDANLAIVRTYDSQVKFMKKSHCFDRDEIGEVEVEARRSYKDLITLANSSGVPIEGYLQHFIRFLKNNRRFREAEDAVMSMEAGYRRCLEEGMLYSSMNARRPVDVARYQNFPRAIECYVKAWHMLMESEIDPCPSVMISVLYPLASALRYSGDMESAYNVAMFGLSIKPDSKLLQIIEQTGHDVRACAKGSSRLPLLLTSA